MTFKQYLMLMTVGTLAALASWFIVLMAIDPVTTGLPTKIAFYFTFFVSAIGVFAIVGVLARVLIIHREAVVSREVSHAFRQAILFASIILICLFMASMEYLRWWTMTLTILLFAGIELFFLTAGRRQM